jgi:hypothetical protein
MDTCIDVQPGSSIGDILPGDGTFRARYISQDAQLSPRGTAQVRKSCSSSLSLLLALFMVCLSLYHRCSYMTLRSTRYQIHWAHHSYGWNDV